MPGISFQLRQKRTLKKPSQKSCVQNVSNFSIIIIIIIIIIMFYSAHVVVYIGFLNSQISLVFFSIFLLVSRLRAGELSELLGFLVSSPYNFSYEEKAGNYMVQCYNNN